MRTPPTAASIDCLSGLSLVFTGELPGFSREEAISLAKRYGGRVVGQPSSKTSYVILGNDAGPSKLKAIEKHKLRTLDEDGFMNLIATRKGPSAGGKVDDKTRKKMEKEAEEIKEGAKELAKREKEAAKAGSGKAIDPLTQLWTVRYAPKTLKEVCGNKGQIERLQQWLEDWPGSLKSGFKKPGKHGTNVYRAMMITGPPGIGKTTSAHLCAQLAGFTPIEMNASDARSKKLIENGANIMNQSLDKWMSGKGNSNAAGVEITSSSCLIMDEVDGMSAGDRGGVGALAALIRKSRVPIICIANDRGAQKLKPLINCSFNLPYKKPDATMIRSRIMTILYKEKMKVPANVVDQLVEGAQSDIRQVLNMLSTWRLSSNTMDFDDSKALVKMNEKYTLMTPFTIIQKLLGPYLFSPNARETLNDKMELYFHDHSFVPLFVQENYLKTTPSMARSASTPPEKLKLLRLMDRAASSLSDADIVDSLIHGPEQHWSLMPLHAITSTVIPASCMYGNTSYAGPNSISFPQWLGQNSKRNKLMRQLGDIQIRMRLKVSGDKPEIRQHYIPSLFPHIVQPLMEDGASAVDEVIERMDQYFLSKDEWDTLIELGVDSHKDELVLKKISTATKTSLTRKYNSREHPVPFHKGQDLGKLPKKLAAEPAPDLEEAYDNDDDIPDDDDDDKKKQVDELAGDKLIKTGKPKASTATKSSAKSK
ncbi:replication factor RFC1 C terminal domain-containing protein, partial [Thelephora terrestris]